jgi:hypothetical protein
MVRHLAIARRVNQVYSLPAINGKRPEPTAPIAHLEETLNIEPAVVENRASIKMIHRHGGKP